MQNGWQTPFLSVLTGSDKDALQGLVMQVMLQARLGGANHFSMIIKN
jgi:hypothetical protein